MEKARHIKRSELEEILNQNRAMRALLQDWPARKVMMDYEKEWDERRRALLENNSAHNDPNS